MRKTWQRFLAGAAVAALGAAGGCRGAGRGSLDTEPRVALDSKQTGDVQVALARTLEARGETQEAIRYYTEAVRNDPARADAWARAAVLYDKDGKFAQSAEAYRQALSLRPDNPDIYCNLGYSLYLQQRWPEAEAALRKAIELNPDHKRAQNNLGLVLARTNRGPEALAAFKQAGCDRTDAHLNMAYALTLNGQLPQARIHYQTALAERPDSDAAKKGLKNLEVIAAKLKTPGEDSSPGGAAAGGAVAAAPQRETPAATPQILPVSASEKRQDP